MFRLFSCIAFVSLMTLSVVGIAEDHGGHGGDHAQAAELKQGRYIGWLKLDERNERIAVVADIFLESPEDLTKFPRLNASFKISLGGYNTHEYMTETFEDLKYDFNNGALTFDEPDNDLLMTTEVHNMSGRTVIMGDVFVRSSAMYGKIEITEESDEPADDSISLSPPVVTPVPFLSLLEGQYEGKCDGKQAMIQLQSIRGLKSGKQNEARSTGLDRFYGISGRVAYMNDPLCGVKNEWCSRYHFSGGTYNFQTGKLNFQGEQSSEQCELRGGSLQCNLKTFDKVVACSFKRKGAEYKSPLFYPRRFHVSASDDQMAELPDPAPPKNSDLTVALRGRFSGYIHNETNDTYLPLRLDVIPFSSTENPHNPNQTMVSSTASVFVGEDFASPFVTQRFEPRSFYLRPGFVLSGASADSFLNVIEWKRGYIRGIWYSHAFGKVGTVQLVKSSELPAIARDAKMGKSFAGDFQRKIPGTNITQWLRFLFPTQSNDLADHVVRFNGSLQSIVGNTPIKDIERGAFDPYTRRLGWMFVTNEVAGFGSGEIVSSGDAAIFWPPAPLVGVRTNPYKFELFKKDDRSQMRSKK